MNEPNPLIPNPLVWATVHVYHACSRLVDYLEECEDCHPGNLNPSCQECEEATGALFALGQIAAALESNQKVCKVIRKAEKRLMEKRVAALERRIAAKEQSRQCQLTVTSLTFSAN